MDIKMGELSNLNSDNDIHDNNIVIKGKIKTDTNEKPIQTREYELSHSISLSYSNSNTPDDKSHLNNKKTQNDTIKYVGENGQINGNKVQKSKSVKFRKYT